MEFIFLGIGCVFVFPIFFRVGMEMITVLFASYHELKLSNDLLRRVADAFPDPGTEAGEDNDQRPHRTKADVVDDILHITQM